MWHAADAWQMAGAMLLAGGASLLLHPPHQLPRGASEPDLTCHPRLFLQDEKQGRGQSVLDAAIVEPWQGSSSVGGVK
ncbi:hypothetical protein CHLRE_09g392105v5 [Chlamydomonas reinhardtii]|uniref:Uncharacterized protein n=1 Tax=Chlamydomonas reinhardtii TaxID=3055 RepID=A0A2K3DDG3_CHLRE|nr:uncharacterized protein CHLRE_09g392105v5 [Chlamydomonas reinhardtii]PNW78563.1 hypothetical protein CHLRE_09g392105v5 [Chlamydomonas reinhardtii]